MTIIYTVYCYHCDITDFKLYYLYYMIKHYLPSADPNANRLIRSCSIC